MNLKEISKDKIVLEKQAEQQKETKLIGKIQPKKGRTLFEVNLDNWEINKAVFESQTISFEQAKSKFLTPTKKVLVNKNCIYISALNVKNLIKKLKNENYPYKSN